MSTMSKIAACRIYNLLSNFEQPLILDKVGLDTCKMHNFVRTNFVRTR